MGALDISSLAGSSLRLTAPAVRQTLTDWRNANAAQVSVTLPDGSTAELNSLSGEQLAEVITGLTQGQETPNLAGHAAPGPSQAPQQVAPASEADAPPAPAAAPPASQPAPPPAVPPAAGASHRELGSSGAAADVGQALVIIAAYVPAEALAAYIAITALLVPVSLGGRAIVLAIAIVLNLLFVLIGIRRAAPLNPASAGQSERRQSGLLTVAATTWALLVYVACIPANMFMSFDWYKMQYGGVAAIITALVLPLVARPQTARSR